AGTAILGDGIASGENRAIKAAQMAIKNPLIDNSIDGAQGILLNISGGPDLKLYEVNEAAEVIRNAASTDANIIFGAVIDESMNEKLKVTIIAAGFKEKDRIFDKPFFTEEKVEFPKQETLKKPEPVFTDKELFEEERKEKKAVKEEKALPEDFKPIEEDDYLDIPTFLRKHKE
ncbi:MAG: cell division protein FtsZ, partial [Actinobacteria bacterium]|nr:cell division protein FtsZ [Actinomycetota bacterium]